MENRTEGKAHPSVALRPTRRHNVGLSVSAAEVAVIKRGAVASGARSFSEYVRAAAVKQAERDLRRRQKVAA